MAERRIGFRLPLPTHPHASFVSDFGMTHAKLLVDDHVLLEIGSREAMLRGAWTTLPGAQHTLEVRILEVEEEDDVHLLVDGVEALREDELSAPTSRSALIHGIVALVGSFFGFVASWLYVLRARSSGDAWAMKMAWHMAAWHLLLTLTLFPASVWGQRIGIRAVQVASLVFFCIHLGIAISNAVSPPIVAEGPWIALLNASSGLAFLAAVLYGQRAHADMDPVGRLP